MADGKSHGIIVKRVTLPITLFTLYITHSVPLAGCYMLGGLLGLYIEPDLDIEGITMSDRRVLNIAGRLGWVWIAIWYPYALYLPHRSILSHAPILGTLIRVVYVLVVLSAISMPLWFIASPWGVLWRYKDYLVWVLLGLIVSDTSHWIADWKCWRSVWTKPRNLPAKTYRKQPYRN